MSDNYTANAGSGGKTFASDEIGGVDFPRGKITIGADGTNDGDVSATNPLPVKGTGTAGTANSGVLTVQGIASMTPIQIADNSSSITVDGTVAATQSGTWTVQPGNTANTTAWLVTGTGGSFPNSVLSAAVNGNDAANSLEVAPRAQYDDASTTMVIEDAYGDLRIDGRRNLYVTIRDAAGNERGLNVDASGNLGVGTHAVTQSGTWNIGTVTTVSAVTSITNALPAGTNAIGKLAANSGVDIGDVDVTSIIPGTGATNLGKAIDTATGATDTGVLVLATRDDALSALTPVEGDNVQLRTDANGALWVIPSGTVTVAGTGTFAVQAAQSGTWNITNVSGTVSLPTGASTLAEQQSQTTALQIIDDWDESDRAKVNLIAAQAGITGGAGAVAANTPRVTLASDDPAVTALQILDNIVSGSEAQVDIVASLPAGTNNIGDVDVLTLPALPAGTNNIGDVDVLSIAAGTNLIGDVGIQPRSSGGCSIFRSIDLDETEEAVKASAGQLYGFIAINLATSVRYLKFYNLTVGDCTVGTSTPVMTIPIPTQAGTANGAGLIFFLPQGIEFTTAITAAATTGIADADVGAPGANELVLQAFYE